MIDFYVTKNLIRYISSCDQLFKEKKLTKEEQTCQPLKSVLSSMMKIVRESLMYILVFR